jgi:NAD(P)-dependent dehydrogenase (short-subunit alcohol dehydrogenase family)
LAPIDAVISTVGTAKLKLLEHTTEADWKVVLDTNVVGVNSAIRVMLPSLATGAIVLALSSEAVTMPRWALGAYGASKAALEVSMAGWRLEFPRVRFGTVGVGSTVPTEFARASVLASLLPFPGINMEHIVLRTPTPAVGTSDLMRAAIET